MKDFSWRLQLGWSAVSVLNLPWPVMFLLLTSNTSYWMFTFTLPCRYNYLSIFAWYVHFELATAVFPLAFSTIAPINGADDFLIPFDLTQCAMKAKTQPGWKLLICFENTSVHFFCSRLRGNCLLPCNFTSGLMNSHLWLGIWNVKSRSLSFLSSYSKFVQRNVAKVIFLS